MATRSSSLSLRSPKLQRRNAQRRLLKCAAGVQLDPPEYNPSKSKVHLETPKNAYGLSVRQMAALGLTGDQVHKRFDIQAVLLLLDLWMGHEVVLGCFDVQGARRRGVCEREHTDCNTNGCGTSIEKISSRLAVVDSGCTDRVHWNAIGAVGDRIGDL